MNRKDLPGKCKTYLVIVYLLAIPIAVLCFKGKGEYNSIWLLLTLASLFVATVGLRLPQVPSVVISMGDVFAIVALIYFGPGPALVTLWIDTLTASITDYCRRHGIQFYRKILLHRLLFNLAASPLAMLAMSAVYGASMKSRLPYPANLALGLALI